MNKQLSKLAVALISELKNYNTNVSSNTNTGNKVDIDMWYEGYDSNIKFDSENGIHVDLFCQQQKSKYAKSYVKQWFNSDERKILNFITVVKKAHYKLNQELYKEYLINTPQYPTTTLITEFQNNNPSNKSTVTTTKTDKHSISKKYKKYEKKYLNRRDHGEKWDNDKLKEVAKFIKEGFSIKRMSSLLKREKSSISNGIKIAKGRGIIQQKEKPPLPKRLVLETLKNKTNRNKVFNLAYIAGLTEILEQIITEARKQPKNPTKHKNEELQEDITQWGEIIDDDNTIKKAITSSFISVDHEDQNDPKTAESFLEIINKLNLKNKYSKELFYRKVTH